MLARIFAILSALLWIGFVGLLLTIEWVITVVYAEGGILGQAVFVSAVLAAASAIPLAICFTGNASPGAVDNASGVVSVLLALRDLKGLGGIGVLVTSGEELALAGARAFVEATQDRCIVLNCDTIDDRGGFVCMTHGRGDREAAAAVTRAAARLGFPIRVRGIISGILADSIAFADAGWDAVTVSRGNLGTLGRVHSSRDTLDRLDGSGIAQAARLLAVTIEELG
jgi:Zn-dependent M28 family amino/carboxypeptidase